MHTEPLPCPVLPSPPRGRDGDTARTAPAVMQVRLTPSTTSHAPRRISRTRGTLRRWRGSFQLTLGRPPRRVGGIHAGLSNTRQANGDWHVTETTQ